jgi:type IV pilus assembly protein PilB
MPAPRKKAAKRRRTEPANRPSDPGVDPPQGTPTKPQADRDREELLNVDQAVDLICTSRPTFYRWLRTGKLKGFKVGRQWRFRREDLERFMRGQEPRTSGPLTELSDLWRELTARMNNRDVDDAFPPRRTFADAADAAAHVVGTMILMAYKRHASDIHLEPMAGLDKSIARVRLRIDGVLHTFAEFSLDVLKALVERWKTMADCDLHETARPQVGRIMVRIMDVHFDLSMSAVPSVAGEAVTVRLLERDHRVPTLDQIRLSETDWEKIDGFLKQPHGLMIVSGPAGCGKTSTMLACVSLLVNEQTKIVSIEDPVEVRIPGMTQVQVNREVGLTYGAGIRALMRMDPDVLVIGELLDPEVLRQALNAALTGHLVFSQTHASSAAATLRRFLDMGADPALLGDAISLVVGQRLVRALCTECRQQQRPTETAIERARAWAGALAGAMDFDRFYVAQGCPSCGTTGYRGRVPLVETLAVTPVIAAAMRRQASADELEAAAVQQGMTTLAADGLRRCQLGETSLEEVTRVLALV